MGYGKLHICTMSPGAPIVELLSGKRSTRSKPGWASNQVFYTSPLIWDLKSRQECSMLNMFIHELLWVRDTEFY